MNNDNLKDRKVLEEWDKVRIWFKKLAFQKDKDLSKIKITNGMNEQEESDKYKRVYIDFHGEKKTLKELSEMSGIPHNAIYQRWKMGDIGDRLIRPLRKTKRGCDSGAGKDF